MRTTAYSTILNSDSQNALARPVELFGDTVKQYIGLIKFLRDFYDHFSTVEIRTAMPVAEEVLSQNIR